MLKLCVGGIELHQSLVDAQLQRGQLCAWLGLPALPTFPFPKKGLPLVLLYTALARLFVLLALAWVAIRAVDVRLELGFVKLGHFLSLLESFGEEGHLVAEDGVEVVLAVALPLFQLPSHFCQILLMLQLVLVGLDPEPLVLAFEGVKLLLKLFLVFAVPVFECIELAVVLLEQVLLFPLVELFSEGLVLAVGEHDGLVELLALQLLFLVLCDFGREQLHFLLQHRSLSLQLLLFQNQLSRKPRTCLFSRKIYFYS